jgi:prepilin-type processing-associated H-X9-DG protein
LRSFAYRRLAVALSLVALGSLLGGSTLWARQAAEITACVERASGYLKVGGSCGSGETLTWNQQGPPGPKGDTGPAGPQGPAGPRGAGVDRPTLAEIAFRTHPPKALTAPAVSPSVKLPKSLALPPAADGQAYSSFHDGAVNLAYADGWAGLPALSGGPYRVSHLDVPPGKYVVLAKAHLLNLDEDYDETASCTLSAGQDFDEGWVGEPNTLGLSAVHVFAKPGRVELKCLGDENAQLRDIKITAIRVAKLANTWVAAG